MRPHQVNGRQLWLAAGLALIAVIVAACVLDSPPVETTEGARCVARGGRWEPADIRKDGYCIDPPGLR